MKKILFTLLVLCLQQALYAQTRGKVVYERVLTFGEASKSTFHLYFDSNKSAFPEQNPPAAEHRAQQTGADEALEFNIRLGSELPYSVFTDFSKNLLYSRTTGAGNKTILVEESRPEIPWKIEEEYKSIGSFRCRKARGAFRGRIYTAWFSSEIPTQSGPWKFNGLPGLILEIYDDKGEVYFGAREVTVPAHFDENLLALQKTGFRVLTLQEHREERQAQVSEVLSAIKSKLPRGASLDFSQQTLSAIETEFEFE